MTEIRTTERVLRLLALLQRRMMWTGPELATELGVTDRCIRRDVERLRALGYPIEAAQGVGGGYRLGSGRDLPPLLLDDDEATAVVTALRVAAASGHAPGGDEAALRTLAKLDRVLPPRVREQVRTLTAATDALDAGPAADAGVLMALARGCRDRVRVRFGYADHRGDPSERTAEPLRLVAAGRRWYLVAWCVDRDDWRTFRLDRMTDVETTTWGFGAREHPDPVAFVQRGVTTAPYRHRVRALIDAPVADVRAQVPSTVGVVTEAPDGRALLETGGDHLGALAYHLASLDAPVEILEPPALLDAARDLASGLSRLSAAGGSG